MTAETLTFYGLLAISGVIALRWLLLGVGELLRGDVVACQERKEVDGDDQ